MWQKIKCWLGLELNNYLISYNFKTEKGSGFGKSVGQANKVSRETVNIWQHQIEIDLGEGANVVILNIVRLDK